MVIVSADDEKHTVHADLETPRKHALVDLLHEVVFDYNPSNNAMQTNQSAAASASYYWCDVYGNSNIALPLTPIVDESQSSSGHGKMLIASLVIGCAMTVGLVGYLVLVP